MNTPTKAEQVKQIVGKIIRTEMRECPEQTLIRRLIFTENRSDNYWIETVAPLIIQLMPEHKVEITKILNPTIAKFVQA